MTIMFFQSFILIIISIQRNLGVDVMAQLMSSMIFHWITSLNYSSHANTIETFTLTRNWLWQVHQLNPRKTFQITEFWNMKRLLKMSKLVVIISQKYWSHQNTIWPIFMLCKFFYLKLRFLIRAGESGKSSWNSNLRGFKLSNVLFQAERM